MEIKKRYIEHQNIKEKEFDLKHFKIVSDEDEVPNLNFGTRIEHDGEYTLYDFSIDSGIKL